MFTGLDNNAVTLAGIQEVDLFQVLQHITISPALVEGVEVGTYGH
jgi:hypothetical protein